MCCDVVWYDAVSFDAMGQSYVKVPSWLRYVHFDSMTSSTFLWCSACLLVCVRTSMCIFITCVVCDRVMGEWTVQCQH